MGARKRDASEPSEGAPRLLHNEIAIMKTLCKIMQNIMQKVVPLRRDRTTEKIPEQDEGEQKISSLTSGATPVLD